MRRLLAVMYAVWLVGCQATIGDPGGASDLDRADAMSDPGGTGADGAVAPPGSADGGAADATIQARCVDRYGDVAGFRFCEAADDACTFVATNGDVSCGDHCQLAGGACVGAEDNDVGECDDLEDDPAADCDTTGKTDLLCTCSLPPSE